MINMTSLEATILQEQLYCFMRFLEVNGFLNLQGLQNLSDENVTKDELIDSIIFNFILDHYGDII